MRDAELELQAKEGRTIDVTVNVSVLSVTSRGSLDSRSILQDITGRKQAEAALRQANRQLNMLNSITRHDILNKVTSILAYLTLPQDDPRIRK